MNESESMRMVQSFRDAWPDDAFSDSDATEVAKMFRAHRPETVAQAIAGHLEAGLGRPRLVDLSRILRAYAPGTASDPEPVPAPHRPSAPWAADLEPLPEVAADLSDRLAEVRSQLGAGDVRRLPDPFDPELRIVPPEIREAVATGRALGASSRKGRLNATLPSSLPGTRDPSSPLRTAS